jgi:2-polyprenyl-3-methyl-5-hydroxy-6-metoxy-1,4-benzoquinol methylase
LCGEARHLSIWVHANDRFLIRQNRTDRIRKVICTRCGLVYSNPQLDAYEIRELYTSAYRENSGIPEQHLRDKETQSRERLEWLSKYYQRAEVDVLEIGCSEGVLLRQMRDGLHWSVRGVEPFEPYARHGVSNWELKIDNAFFMSELYSDGRFDLVTFMHVIEHIPEPVEFLKDVSRMLTEDGHIFFETPNLWSPKIGRISAALFASPHLAILSPKSAELLLRRAGFELVRLETKTNLRVLAKRKRAATESDQDEFLPGGFLHASRMVLSYRIFWLCEKSLYAKWAVEAFLVRNAKRLLTPRAYEQIRKLYRSV